MSTTQDPKATPSSPESLLERLGRLQRELALERSRVQRTSVLTIIVGVLLLAVLGGYFGVGYVWLQPLANVDNLLFYAEDQLDRRLPEGRRLLENQIRENAPQWAERLSQQAYANVPYARTKLEEFALEQFESSMNEATARTDEEFRKFLHDNHDQLEKYFKELADKPELAEIELQDLRRSLEAQVGADIKTGAKQLLDLLVQLNARLRRLLHEKNLSPEEDNERRLLMLARRLVLEQMDPNQVASLPALDPSTPIRKSAPRVGAARSGQKVPVSTVPNKDAKPAETKKDSKPAESKPDAQKKTATPDGADKGKDNKK
jgi:hypothetical protein